MSLLNVAASRGGVQADLIERDYWMCEIATALNFKSEKYPGSFTSMGGGSFLSLSGITERLSEDVDITVTFADGALNASSNKSKRLMVECHQRVESELGITGQRLGGGGGNFFRAVNYPYPSVLPHESSRPPILKSDKGLRDASEEYLVQVDAMPYLGRVAQSEGLDLPADLAPRTILGTHPIQTLADKMDAVCWREALVPEQGDAAIAKLTARIRDHYDILCIIGWLRSNELLDRDRFLAAREHSEAQDAVLRKSARLRRAAQPRPEAGYHTLRAWQPGTREHAALSERYGTLAQIVYGDLPPYSEVCETVHSAAGII